MYPEICKNRIQLLKKFNPNIKIFGLFGGKKKDFKKFKNVCREMENVYIISGKTKRWRWKNGDLALREWFRDYGKNLKFDMLHLIEWDLLLFDSIPNIYKKIPKNGVGLTGLMPIKEMDRIWKWVSKEPYKTQWFELLGFVRKKFGYNKEPYGCIGGGVCLPRKFMEEYSKIKVPEFCNDEIRYPLFSQVFGIKLCDTGFYRKWFDNEEHKYLNALGEKVSLSTIKKELSKLSGRRVFHPYRKIYNFLK